MCEDECKKDVETRNENMDSAEKVIEDKNLLETVCCLVGQMSCGHKIFYFFEAVVFFIFSCVVVMCDSVRQFDAAIEDFAGKVPGTLSTLLAILFTSVALMVTLGSKSPLFRQRLKGSNKFHL